MKWQKLIFSALLATSIGGLCACSSSGDVSSSREESSLDSSAILRFEETSLTLAVGATHQLSVKVFGSSLLPSWNSSDPSVASVSPAGVVSSKKEGSCTIEARIGGSKAECQVAVLESPALPTLVWSEDSVSLRVNTSTVLSCSAYQGGVLLPNLIYSYSLGTEGDAGVFSFSVEGNNVSLLANRPGEGYLYATTTYEGRNLVSKAKITVLPASPFTCSISNLTKRKGGYSVSLFSKGDENHLSSITPKVSLYRDGILLPDAHLSWTSSHSDVAFWNGDSIQAVKPGETNLVGFYSNGFESISVSVTVSVFAPLLSLTDTLIVERENYTTLTQTLSDNDRAMIGGSTIQRVLLGEKNVGTYRDGRIMFDLSSLPVFASEMGEQKILLEAFDATYVLPIRLYTKIIRTATDLKNMGSLAKNAIPDSKPRTGEFAGYSKAKIPLWDGYFLLGNNIVMSESDSYDSPADSVEIWENQESGTTWDNGMMYGFRGVFDGQGYNIEGLSISEGGQSGGLFGVLQASGKICNVSFTKASLARASGFVCSAGAGLVSNVMVRYDHLGFGANSTTRHYGTCFPVHADHSAVVKQVFSDAFGASLSHPEEGYLLGIQGGYRRENVVGISDSPLLRKASPITGIYEDYEAFSRQKISFTGDVWEMHSGIPIFSRLYSALAGQTISFVDTPAFLIPGSSWKVKTKGDYLSLSLQEGSEGVTLSQGRIMVARNAPTQTILLSLRSLLDENQTVSLSLPIRNPEVSDFTNENGKAMIDLAAKTADLSSFDGFGEIEPAFFLTANQECCSWNALSVGDTKLGIVTSSRLYWVNARIATRILRTAEELTSLGVENASPNDGYYLLAKDVDAREVPVCHAAHNWNWEGFVGIFDGQGHSISNLNLTGKGLFAAMGKGSVLRNLTFDDLSLGPNETYVLAKSIKGANLSHLNFVCRSVSSARWDNLGFLAQVMNKTTTLNEIRVETRDQKVGWVLAKNGKAEGTDPDNVYTDVQLFTTHQNFILGDGSTTTEYVGNYSGITVTYTDAS